MDAKEMRGPPLQTATTTPAGERSRGADRPAMQHDDTPNMAALGSGEASTASQPDREPEGPMRDTECEDGLRPPSAHGAQPAGRAGAAPLTNSAHHANACAPRGLPPRDPPETHAKSETRETTPNTPQCAAGRETSPSKHNPDEDSFHAFMESCMGHPHTVPTPAAPRVGLEQRSNHAEHTPLSISHQANLQRDYTALGHTGHATAAGDGHAAASRAADRTRTGTAPQEARRAWQREPTPLASLPAHRRGPPRPGGGDIWTTHAWRAMPASPATKRNRRRPETWAYGSSGLPQGSSYPWQSASDGCLLLGLATSRRGPAPWQTSPSAIGRGIRPPPP